MKTSLFFLTAALAWSQAGNVRVEGVTSTQIVISYIAPNANACTLELSENANYSPLLPDVNAALFSGSNSDSARAVTIVDRRFFIAGTRTAARASDGRMYSRALPSATHLYGRITCGTPVAFEAETAPVEGLTPEVLPFNADAVGNFGFPDWSFTQANRGKALVDPQTGAKIYHVTDPRDLSHAGEYNFPSGVYFQGSGWTNPANITAASTSTKASTATANAPIFVPVNTNDAAILGQFNFYQVDGILVDLGLHVYGNGTDANASNRQVSVCLSVDSGQSCFAGSNAVTVTLPAGAADLGIFPAAFPTAGAANPNWEPFVGWGKMLSRQYFSTGKVQVTSGAVTLTQGPNGGAVSGSQDIGRSWFRHEWPAGAKIFIAGSSPTCPNNYCTLSSVASGTSLTIDESLTLTGDHDFRFAGVGFRIVKLTTGGTVSLSAKYALAKSFSFGLTGGGGCSSATVSTNVDRAGNPISPGIVGHLCVFAKLFNEQAGLYFVGVEKPEFRLLSVFRPPTTPAAGHTSDDWPFPPGEYGSNSPTIFDSANPNIIYLGLKTIANFPAIFKLTYSGDYRELSGVFFKASLDASIPTYVNDNISWVNVTKPSAGQDLRTRILAAGGYSESLWGSLAGSNLTFVGIAANKAIFTKLVASQDDACWIFVFNAATGAYERGMNTVTGGGGGGDRFGGCHSVGVVIDRIGVANNGLNRNSTGTLYGGPFLATPTHVWKNGSPSANTALPFAYDGSYDGACPGGLPQVFVDLGATGSRCATIRFAGEPCSSVAATLEKATTPCPGDPTKSWIGSAVQPGDEFYDPAAAGGPDAEHMLVVKRTPVDGNIFDLVVLRDAGRGYCCLISGSGGADNCADSDNQAIHGSNWTARFVPLGSCGSAVQFYNPGDLTDYAAENQMFIRGHFGYTKNGANNENNVGVSSTDHYRARFNAPIAAIGTISGFKLDYRPSFAGIPLDTSVLQSYISVGLGGTATDWRHVNGGLGIAIEWPALNVGAPHTIAAVAGQSNTYKVTGFTATDIKRQGLAVWVGGYNLGDMSSAATGNVISDANPWRYCYAYRGGECRSGSVVGELYLVAPGLETAYSQCHSSQIARRVLCVFPAGAGFAQLLQLDATQSDVSGLRQRRIGPGLTRYGAQYVFSKTQPFSASQPFKFLNTAYHQGDVNTVVTLIDPGPWMRSSKAGNDFVPVPVQIPALAGANQARVRFGYADYGTAGTNFYCTSRPEDCLTDAALSPFAFASDAPTPAACSSGCTINIPALPGRVLFFGVERLNSGVPVSNGALQVMAVE